jgi:hypothetical protein
MLDKWRDELNHNSEISESVRERMMETISGMSTVMDKDTKHGRKVYELEERLKRL